MEIGSCSLFVFVIALLYIFDVFYYLSSLVFLFVLAFEFVSNYSILVLAFVLHCCICVLVSLLRMSGGGGVPAAVPICQASRPTTPSNLHTYLSYSYNFSTNHSSVRHSGLHGPSSLQWQKCQLTLLFTRQPDSNRELRNKLQDE